MPRAIFAEQALAELQLYPWGAALLWSVYHHFTSAQARYRAKRRYPRAGKCALELAGTPTGRLSYLDALGV
jgi:hypothetical protein